MKSDKVNCIYKLAHWLICVIILTHVMLVSKNKKLSFRITILMNVLILSCIIGLIHLRFVKALKDIHLSQEGWSEKFPQIPKLQIKINTIFIDVILK